MDRRYRMELQLVRVPVIWKAKVPVKKLWPVTRKVPEKRSREKQARAAVHMFFAQMFEGVPMDFCPPEFQRMNKPEGKLITWRRWMSLEDMYGPAADDDCQRSGEDPGI